MKKIIFIFILLIITSLGWGQNGSDDLYTYTRARITKIERKQVVIKNNLSITETRIHLKVLDGENKDKTKLAVFGGESDLPKDMDYEVGNTVYIGISETANPETPEYISIYDHDNTAAIIILGILLITVIVLVGRIKGIMSMVALIITILLLFFILIPLTLKGYPPLPVAVAIAIVSIIITLPIIAGFKRKTLAAILGASGGILFASLMAIGTGLFIHMSGIITNEMLTVFYASDVDIDIKGLVLAGMIIAALGAVMDVCISIASSTSEIFQANPDLGEKEAFKSVLNIGTDILGSMVNTLILAYVGSSLSMILLITMRLQPEMPFMMVLNYNPVLSEIVKSVVGSLGMFIAIPLTAFISVKFLKKNNNH